MHSTVVGNVFEAAAVAAVQLPGWRRWQPRSPHCVAMFLLPLRAAMDCVEMVLQHAVVVLKAESLVTKRPMGSRCGVSAVVRVGMPPLPVLCESLLPMKDTTWTPILRTQHEDSVFTR